MKDPAVTIGRLRRKLAQRDQRIDGLKRRIAGLEHELAVAEIAVRRVPIEVTRAVQEALCNVRMIPVLGVGGSDRIIKIEVGAKA